MNTIISKLFGSNLTSLDYSDVKEIPTVKCFGCGQETTWAEMNEHDHHLCNDCYHELVVARR